MTALTIFYAFILDEKKSVIFGHFALPPPKEKMPYSIMKAPGSRH
jgi:hypothetical protein